MVSINYCNVFCQCTANAISDSISCYLINDNAKTDKTNLFSLKLVIENNGSDTLLITNFCKTTFHRYDLYKSKYAFCWDLQTLSNEQPKNIVITDIGFAGVMKEIKVENEYDIYVLPKQIFSTVINIRKSSFLNYFNGFYKLCLFDNYSEKYISEIIVEIK